MCFWTEAGKRIKLLGEKSRKFLLCWYRFGVLLCCAVWKISEKLKTENKKIKIPVILTRVAGFLFSSFSAWFSVVAWSRKDHLFKFGRWAAQCDNINYLKLINQYMSYYFTHWLYLFSFDPLTPFSLPFCPNFSLSSSFLFVSSSFILSFTSSVRRLSAAASGEDSAQHCDGESRRWLDGSGRVPG